MIVFAAGIVVGVILGFAISLGLVVCALNDWEKEVQDEKD